MNYQQSLQNIEKIKNFVFPWNCRVILFVFNNDREFKIEFYKESTWSGSSRRFDEILNTGFPAASIVIGSQSQEILTYVDENLALIFDLFSCKTESVDFNLKLDMGLVRKQFLHLVGKTK